MIGRMRPAACKGSGRAHLLWRTDEIAPQAPPKARFLMGLPRLLR